MKNQKRALRRFHKQRIEKKRRKYLVVESQIEANLNHEGVKLILKTPTPCSCWMCGNPRKYHKEKTIQELKANEKFQSDMKNLVA